MQSDTSSFLDLPRELRDMIYDYACAGNSYIARHFDGERIKPVPFPLTDRSLAGLSTDTTACLPSTLCRAQAVCKQIFNESLPILIQNTTFDFRYPAEFEDYVTCCQPLARHLTTLRIHEGFGVACYHSFPFPASRSLFSSVSPEISDKFSAHVKACTRLKSLTWVVNRHTGRFWPIVEAIMKRANPAWDISDDCKVFTQLKQVQGDIDFRLLVVDSATSGYYKRIEALRVRLEAEIRAAMLVKSV